MAASWYKLYISTFDFTDDSKNEVELRFVWEGLDGTERDYTDKFEIYTRYHVVNNKGERRIDREDPSTTITPIPGQTEYVYYWDVPDRCVEVEMKVVAYSKTYNSNGNQVPHWDIGLTKEVTTGTDEGIVHWLYCGESHKPDKADTPTVTQNPRLGTQVALELSDIRETEGNNKDITKVEFQVLSFENDADTGSIVAGVHEAIVTDLNNCRYVVSIGTAYGYKFRARYWAGKAGESSKITGDPWAANASPIVDIAGEWSDLTDMVYGVPNVPSISEMKKQNRTQLYMKFDCEGYWHHLQMQIASTRSAFNKMDTWEIEHPDAIEDQDARSAEILVPPPLIAEITIPAHTIEYLYDYPTTQGGRLFYRVRAVSAESGAFYSGWSEVKEFQFLEGLKKPMVWMNTPYATVGDNYITLNFMHNSPTGTQTTGAQIMYRVNSGTLKPYPPTGIIDPPSNSNVYQLAFPLTDFTEECVINWQVRTSEFGEAGQDERHWSEFSDNLQFWVYEKPEIEITFPDIPENEWIPANVENDSSTIPVVAQFPLHFLITPTLGGEQAVTSYLIRIISLEAYGEYDGYGNKRFVNAGEVLYSTYDNTSKGAVDKYLNVTDCTLSNGKRYELSVIAYINTGVVAKTEAMFTVNIPQPDYVIEASVAENADAVSMLINPRAVKYEGTGLITPEHWELGSPVPDNITGYYIWYDGSVYHSNYNQNGFIYNPETNEWIAHTHSGYQYIYGQDVWHCGDHIYYSSASTQCEYNKETDTWSNKTWYQWTSFDGKNVWHVGDHIYYSSGTAQFELNVETDTWYPKTWHGLNSYYGQYIWYYNGHIYYSYVGAEYELNVETDTWEVKTWTGINTSRMLGSMIWSDGTDYYHSYDNGTYKLIDETTGEWELMDWEESILNGSCVWFNGENAHYTINNNDWIFYPAISSETVRTYPNDITLSVYRKNQDGTMVAIAENLSNADSVYITDPHPHLMKNSYRIVGKNINSGTMSFADTPEYAMHCTDIVIQWDENIHFTDVTANDLPSEYSGNILRLPYNVDVSETAGIENNMVKYIGRKDPVSYYGTQTGYTASWNTVIPKSNRETIALLRKLQVWPGDCYVREPSGTGYWANVKVTFPINHVELTVSVSISITRVEGGM